MNSSIRFVSPAWNSPTSRNESTCRSGMIRTWTSACGLMSLIATKPRVFATYAPFRAMSQNRQPSCGDGKDPLPGQGLGTDPDELADRRIDQERRVVVAVPAAGAVDEHALLAAELRAP